MATADIWQIVIGIISIVSSVSLSLIIFYYQVQTDKKVRKQDINNQVTSFIIENKDEIDLLPLCIVSNTLHKTDKHSHKIYTAYNRLDKSIQEEILKHEDIKNEFNISIEVIDKCISIFEKTEKQYEMGKSMLYDGAKYLHRAYEYYKNESIDNTDPHVFKTPYPTFFPEINTNLQSYIDTYLLHKINPNDDLLIKVQEKYYIPPMDLLYSGFDLGNCEEKQVCFWIMRYIISTCYVLNNRELTQTIDDDKMPFLEEFNIITYEDMYYYTLYVLIKTFSNEIMA